MINKYHDESFLIISFNLLSLGHLTFKFKISTIDCLYNILILKLFTETCLIFGFFIQSLGMLSNFRALLNSLAMSIILVSEAICYLIRNILTLEYTREFNIVFHQRVGSPYFTHLLPKSSVLANEIFFFF